MGTEVPMTKECFPFQANLHILIEGRCLELIQCSKLELSTYSAQRNKILRAQWDREGQLYGGGDILRRVSFIWKAAQNHR
jgi:hypothetical protein